MFHNLWYYTRMKTQLQATGIIVEYNPFHNGHRYHIEKTRELTQCDVLIAVMSPHFVQRGEPALLDKWIRTQAALEQGVDLVLELPTHLALQSAEVFAKNSVKILSMMHTDSLVYGSESLEIPKTQNVDMAMLSEGYSYAKSKNTESLQSNQILGAYYEEAALKYSIKTHRILRTNAYHSLDLDAQIASASAIRMGYNQNLEIAHTTPLKIHTYPTYHIESLYPQLRYEIIKEKEALASYLMVDEGIENLFLKLARTQSTYQDFIKNATSRRYTSSRIRRTLMHILLKTPRDIEPIREVRVLGFNEVGKAYLHQVKDTSPFKTSFKNYQFKDLEEKATALYGMIHPKEMDHLLEKESGPPIII